MIALDRTRIQPDPAWQIRAQEATEAAKREGAAHRVRENVYQASELKQALETLSHRKCAYCEANLGDLWDVEHYRPKGRVRERPDHPGYYWLAYTWGNLLPACKGCNQHLLDRPTFEDSAPSAAGGKSDQFPLVDESQRAMDHQDDLAAEQPLLLDPCLDDPERYFDFQHNGQIFARDPADRRARKTIGICHLKRRRLRDRRFRAAVIAAKALENLRLATAAGEAHRASSQGVLDLLVSNDSEFAAVARAVIRDPLRFEVLASLQL